MTPRDRKPSAHDVMIGCWVPTSADEANGRYPGFGVTTNIINGALECNIADDYRVNDRVDFFLRYTELFGVTPGPNLYCDTQMPFS